MASVNTCFRDSVLFLNSGVVDIDKTRNTLLCCVCVCVGRSAAV